MWIKAICRTEKDAWTLTNLLKRDRRITYNSAVDQHRIDHNSLFNGIYWWKDKHDPVNLPDDVYWQEDKTVEEFELHICKSEQIKKEYHQYAFEFIKELYPTLEWVVKEEPYQFTVRLKHKHGTFPVSLDLKDLRETSSLLLSVSFIQQYVKELSDQYSYLFFHPGTTEMPYTEMGSKVTSPYHWSVYVNQNGRDGTHTGYKFMWPVTEEIRTILTELNIQAGLSLQEGFFFCTGCHQAKTNYAGFWFASTLCEDCATPEWKAKAARESYE